MTPNSGESTSHPHRIGSASYWNAEVDNPAERGLRCIALHDDFPDWVFRLTYTADGVPCGFAMLPTDGTLLHLSEPERLPSSVARLTARVLRTVPLGELQDGGAAWLRSISATGPTATAWRVDPIAAARLHTQGRHVAERMATFARRPGRAGRPDREYAELASTYVDWLASRLDSGKPETVPDLAGRLHLSAQTLRNGLYEARRRGLLTKAPRGKLGGELTDTARRLLADDG